MATDYPIEITDPDGSVRIAGLADFIDPSNAPSTSLPFGIPQSISLSGFTTPSGGGASMVGAGQFVGGGTEAGKCAAFVTLPPASVAAMGVVCDASQLVSVFLGTLDATADPLSIYAEFYVTDLTATNTASANSEVASGTPTGGLFTLTADSSTIPWQTGVGVDLTSAGTVLSSTAGGVFIVAIGVHLQVDD